MTRRIGVWTVLLVLLTTVVATAQDSAWRESNAQGGAAQPPTLQQQPAGAPAPQPLAQAPFSLTPEEQGYMDKVLAAWEQQSDKVSTFETKFTRREYDPVFGPKDAAKFTDQGMLKYKRPDKGLFRIDGDRPEQWISDGAAIFEFNHQKKQLIEHKLPAEAQGKAIEDGPLPFLFGAKAEKIKQRYWIRPIASPDPQNQIWLNAYPRHQQDAANFQQAVLILSVKDMCPLGIKLYLPNGKSSTTYTFFDVVVNDPNPLRFLQGDPFSPRAPLGWTKVVEEAPATQASTEPAGGRR